jgi:hypothetical protein
MAATTNRVVELQIKLSGVQTLQELDDITKEINDELKGIATNSKEFTQMGNLAKQANSRVKEVSSSLEGITSTEKSEAINKMGMALVGVFQGAAGASLLFGDKAGKQLEEVIKKVGGLFAVTDSLKKITEAFSAKNLSALKSVVAGWKESALAAKLFGTTTKTALISTGIGALVVLLGVMIANWDKIKKATINAFNALKELFPPFRWIANTIDSIADKVGSLGNLLKGIGAGIMAIFKGENFGTAFDNAVESAKQLDSITSEYQKTILDTNDAFEQQIALLSEMGNKEQDILDLEIERNKQIVDILTKKKQLGILTEEEAKALKTSAYQLELLNIKQLNLNKKKSDELKASKDKADADRKAAEARAKEYDDLKKLAVTTQEEILLKLNLLNINGELAKLDVALINPKSINAAADALEKFSVQIQTIYTDSQGIINILPYFYDMFKLWEDLDISTVYAEALKDNEQLLLYDEKRLQILQDFNNGLFSAEEREKQLANLREAREKYMADLQKSSGDALVRNLSMEDKARITILLTTTKQKIAEYDRLIETEKTLKAQVDNAELLANSLENVNGKEIEYAKALTDAQQLELLRLDIIEQLNAVAVDINKTEADTTEILKQNAVESTKLVAIQKTGLQNLKDWFAKNDELVSTYIQLVGQIGELQATMYDRQAEMSQRELDTFIKANEEKVKSEVDAQNKIAEAKIKAQEDVNKTIDDLNALLADAEGERYNDILAMINEQSQVKQDAIDAEMKARDEAARIQAEYDRQVAFRQFKIDEAKWMADKARKAADVSMAIMETALAVIKALPNIPLSVVVGILGAAGIATILATPLAPRPVPPQFAEGGYTSSSASDSKPAGIVHANEWVAPAHMVRNPKTSAIIKTLEGMRLKGYANGGIVTTPTPNASVTTDGIDYKMLGAEVANALRANPMFVSVVEFRNVESRLNIVERRASIGNK